ncbi:MAG: peptidase [Gammaproteobacteria bacterium BRH_c0]|nr:MAG: peptidase [Gammaproteobacteria bacterium BRH_c0]
MKPYFQTLCKFSLYCAVFSAGLALISAAGFYLYLSPRLPSPEALRTVKLQTPLRVYSRDGLLMGEFGEKRRTPVSFSDIPEDFVHAILSAEDDNFYNHSGVDITGLIRAAVELATTGEIQSGGSTITMQVARNFFLSTEQSFIRKFNEILLALRIEDELSKDEILTLYANKIFLGSRAYGVEAAAQVYYGKHIHELSLDQLALIAGLPKAPSAFNPLVNPARAMARRDWILTRMYKLDFIDEERFRAALKAPMNASYHGASRELEASYIAEMARQEAIDKFGLDAYNEGYRVFTTVDSKLQLAANQSLRDGLESYDARHGYRGAERHVPDPANWPDTLIKTPDSGPLLAAIVTAVSADKVDLLLKFGAAGSLSLQNNSEIRLYINENARSAPVRDFSSLFKPGDLIRVRKGPDDAWLLAQVPQAQAALVAIDPENGAIRALVGGFDFELSHFNRAVQAERQPGSNFKPFIYAKALESGMTAATLINDAPVVFRDPNLEKVWRPENDSGKFYGPTRLRKALYLSRNLVSIRILRQIGIKRTIASMERFGFDPESLPKNLSLALGTQATTPLKIANGYTAFANGGYRVNHHVVDRIESENGELIFQANPATVCRDCDSRTVPAALTADAFSPLEQLFVESTPREANSMAVDTMASPTRAERIMDARVAFIMDSILKDAIKLGTGKKALVLNRDDIAGKTGTTNGPRDVWFSGYSPHLVATVWVGFDENHLLGRNEYGGSAALPIWIDFMKSALADKPPLLRPPPPGLVTARIDPNTGQRVGPGYRGALLEYFLEEKTPPLSRGNRPVGGNSRGAGEEDNGGSRLPDNLF